MDKTKSSGRGLSLSFVVGSVVAWCTNPTFTGWAGFGKSLLVGLGTSVGSTIGGIGGLLAGGLVGGVIGGALGKFKPKAMLAGALIVGIPTAIGGGVVGAVKGYNTVEGWLLQKDKAAAEFNKAATAPKVADEKTLVLTKDTIANFKPAK